MKPIETVDYNVKVCWHNINRMYNVEAVKHGITTAIGFVLLNIDENVGTPATTLPSLLGLETNSLSRLLKSMESKGLISREVDANDKRMIRVRLTDIGKKSREVSRNTVLKFNNNIRDHIDPSKLSIFFEVIQDINDLLENKKILETA